MRRRTTSLILLQRFCRKNSCKIILIPPKQEEPQYRHRNSQSHTRMAQQPMKQQNVDNHWSQQRQSQWNESVRQQQCPAEHLHSSDEQHILRREQNSQEFPAHSGRQHRRQKMQKRIQPEHHEHQSQQHLRNNRRDLHFSSNEKSKPY